MEFFNIDETFIGAVRPTTSAKGGTPVKAGDDYKVKLLQNGTGEITGSPELINEIVHSDGTNDLFISKNKTKEHLQKHIKNEYGYNC